MRSDRPPSACRPSWTAPTRRAARSTAKAVTGGTYLSGQPLGASPPSTLWGYQFVVSGALGAGTAIVGSFRRGAAIYRKRAIRTEISQDHADFFIRTLVAIRWEVREVLAVFVPRGFIEVTNLGA